MFGTLSAEQEGHSKQKGPEYYERCLSSCLLGVVNSQLARDVVVVGGVALGRNTGDLWLLDVVIPALFLAEVNCIFLGAEFQRCTLHVIAAVGAERTQECDNVSFCGTE